MTTVLNSEPVETVFRIYDGQDMSGEMGEFMATGTAHYHGDVAVLYGWHGKLTAKDIFEVYQHCANHGKRWLIAHRKDGRTLPGGKLIPDHLPFGGWWYVDLTEERIQKRIK